MNSYTNINTIKSNKYSFKSYKHQNEHKNSMYILQNEKTNTQITKSKMNTYKNLSTINQISKKTCTKVTKSYTVKSITNS